MINTSEGAITFNSKKFQRTNMLKSSIVYLVDGGKTHRDGGITSEEKCRVLREDWRKIVDECREEGGIKYRVLFHCFKCENRGGRYW